MNIEKALGRKLRELRHKAKRSQSIVSKKTGICQTAVSTLETISIPGYLSFVESAASLYGYRVDIDFKPLVEISTEVAHTLCKSKDYIICHFGNLVGRVYQNTEGCFVFTQAKGKTPNAIVSDLSELKGAKFYV